MLKTILCVLNVIMSDIVDVIVDIVIDDGNVLSSAFCHLFKTVSFSFATVIWNCRCLFSADP